jgi:Flp pilus assembly protein TadD
VPKIRMIKNKFTTQSTLKNKQNKINLDMKRISLLLMAVVFISGAAIGQKKPKLSKIESLYKAGNIAEALQMVTDAETYEKTKDNKKTYFLKGMIYAQIDTAGLDLAENPRQIARAAFDKYEELEEPDKETSFVTNSGFFTYSQLIETYYSHFFNKGASAYADEDYATAVTEFGKAAEIKPTDTTAYLYGGYAASNAENQQQAKFNYEKALELGATSKDPINLLTYIYSTVDGDTEKALAMTRKGIEMFPEDNDFRRNEIQFLIQLDKIEEAQTNLITAIENEPDDPALRFSLGVMYDNLAETKESEEEKNALQEKAMEAYTQAIEVDPTYLNAYYNAGVMMIAKANKIITERNNLGYSKADLKKADEMEPMIAAKLKEALPYWEKVNELEPNELKTLETLQYLYVQLKMMDEAEAVTNELDQLGGGN